MKFTCAYYGKEHKDDLNRSSLKLCRPSNFIVAYFTFCNTEHKEKFIKTVYLIRNSKK